MEQLLIDFNTNESNIGIGIIKNKNYISILQKYDISILIFILDKIKIEQHNIFKAIVERRQNGGEAKNMTCGYNVMDECIQKINLIILEKEEEMNTKYIDEHIIKIKLQLFYIIIFVILILTIGVCLTFRKSLAKYNELDK